MPEKTQPKTLHQELQEVIEKHLKRSATKEGVQRNFDELIKHFRQLQAQMDEKSKELSDKLEQEVERLGREGAGVEARARKQLEGEVKTLRAEIDILRNELSADVGYVESLIERYDDTELREKLEEVKNMIPEMPEMPEKFDPSDILKKLADHKTEIDALRKRPTGGGTRRVFQPYLDRFQGDGSTKTFYLKREPLRTDNIEVWGTDFPIVLDPDNDFTVTGKNLTLTSEVDAPTNGAILVIKYYA